MQWKKIGAGVRHTYQLTEGNHTLATISINHGSSVLRTMCQSIQRVFFIHKEGFWKNRTVLKNEYGQKMGNLYYEKVPTDKGIVEIDNRRFQYAFSNSSLAEITVYNEGEQAPLLACSLAPEEGQTMIEPAKQQHFANADLQYLLFALTWYLFLPAAQENGMASAL